MLSSWVCSQLRFERVRRPATVLLSASLLACASPDGNMLTAPSGVAQRSAVESQRVAHSGVDAAFDTIARDVPSFAGVHYDNGEYVVSLTALDDSLPAKRLIESALRARLVCYPGFKCEEPSPKMRYRSVQHTWRELSQLRDDLRGRPGFSEALTADVDERLNRVSFGVVSEVDARALRSEVERSAVGFSAVDISRVEPPRPDQGGLLLTSRFRPLTGGFEIGPRGCTATIVGLVNGAAAMLTNGHCTATGYAPDFGQTSQPWSGTMWGAEVHDPFPYSCGVWYNRKRCRRADLAAYTLQSIDLLEGETQQFQLGVIARPTERRYGPFMQYGPLQVDSYLQVAGTLNWAVVGEEVDRVGKATGWQYGNVYQTCSDINYGVLIVCSDRATTFSEPGDSGSPMFRRSASDPNQVFFLGINHGSNANDDSNFYSNFAQMRQEIPSLCFAYGC